MKYGFVKCACLSPELRVADCAFNAQKTAELALAHPEARVAVFPELGLTGYTCGDLFLQRPLQDAAERGLAALAAATKELDSVLVAGVPVRFSGKLYNCAAVLLRGRLLGLVPKTFLPNYGEFYEKRHFSAGFGPAQSLVFAGQETVMGTDILFCCTTLPQLTLAAEVCEDLWAPASPSQRHALAGATVIANLSASNETVGKPEYRRQLVAGRSAALHCAYLYANAGRGESTTDMVFSAHSLIAENGVVLAEAVPFGTGLAETEVDVQRLEGERLRSTSFAPGTEGYTRVDFALALTDTALTRPIPPLPFVPGSAAERAARCELILRMQAEGLAHRAAHAHAQCLVIGISGGLDSCLALLAAVRAMELLGRSAADVVAVTMPCFGTTARTHSNAEILCEQLGVRFEEVSIAATVRSHFADIGQSESVTDVTFENAQARVRTLVLMDLANKLGGLVVGTGDLSELALGWATYNGDHMSMYGVNAGIPKTLVRHMVRWAAEQTGNRALAACLLDILDTPVSPELLPSAGEEMSQQTEELVGPYELHDFYLYHVLRLGFGPAKILYLAKAAFQGQYEDAVLLHWLKNFYRRFFAQQFKRSCLPDGPKVGSVTLSPRGDWRMPSDAWSTVWMQELEAL